MDWVDTPHGSGRKRRAAHPVPEALPELLNEEQRVLLRRWCAKRAFGEAMGREGRKAEQEGWL